jgi:hypothetical protein
MTYFVDNKGSLIFIDYSKFHQKRDFYKEILEKIFNYTSDDNIIHDINNQINSLIKK